MRLFSITLLFLLGCSISKPRGKAFIPFDFSKSSSIELLDLLVGDAKRDNYFMIDPNEIPDNWVKNDDLVVLISRLESNRIACPVYSIVAGISYSRQVRSTEGLEAWYILESVRSGLKYPMATGSWNYGIVKDGVYYPDPEKVEQVKQWFEGLY